MKGNVVDMAVGVIVGMAFGKIVTSLVNDLIMPLIGAITGGINFTGLAFTMGEATVAYGNFLQSVVDFTIIAVCIFVAIKLLDRMVRKEQAKKENAPTVPEDVALLREIRDALVKKRS